MIFRRYKKGRAQSPLFFPELCARHKVSLGGLMIDNSSTILQHTYRRVKREKNTKVGKIPNHRIDYLIADVKNYIDHNAFEINLQLKHMVHKIGWSPFQFSRRFSAYLGITPRTLPIYESNKQKSFYWKQMIP